MIRRATTAIAACLVAVAPAAAAVRPGPDLLYEKPPEVPELSVALPFRAAPLLVSGTDAYRGGEYLYQDYLFDDHGADTGTASTDDSGGPRSLLTGLVKEVRGNTLSVGDAEYPPGERYAGNAADLVEFRVRPTAEEIVYRITLNTVIEPGAAAVVIGIDTDLRGDELVEWPHGAGVSSPGIDTFITAWGTSGEVSGHGALPPVAVSTDAEANQMTIRVPRSMLDPGMGTWRFVVGAGAWGGGAFMPVEGAPAIYNLGFRFHEPASPGHLRESEQARALREGHAGPFTAAVDFAALADGADRWIHPPGATQSRILASRWDAPEGFHDGNEEGPVFGGRLQPYGLHVPPGYHRGEPRPLLLALHGAGATYNWGAQHPGFLGELGEKRAGFVLVPHQRRQCCYQPEVYFDIFEAWADAARRFSLDARRAAVAGYSAGAYNTFRLAIEYPDLFGRAFAVVGAARNTDGGDSNWIPMLANMRWVPWLAWNGYADTSAPYAGIELTRQHADELGLRHEVWGFPSDHNTLGDLDEWQPAGKWLGEAEVERDPPRIDYAINPGTWVAERGLIADHAYWVSGLRIRDATRDDTGTARGFLTVESHAFGAGDSLSRLVAGAHPGPPLPATIVGREWRQAAAEPAENALQLELTNLATVTIDAGRARLNLAKPLTVTVTSDGPATVVLEFGGRDRRLDVGAGTRVFLLRAAP